ncbi:MAG: tetratricopeptide repeat protein [Verrucomicrobiae bacterium]|nr:tetratricopeptide repeat protein [Verrucomicrobiae bacterium]
MKARNLLIASVCVVVIGLAVWKIATLLRSREPESPKPLEAAAPDPVLVAAYADDPPALGLGDARDRKWIEYFYRHRALKDTLQVMLRIAKLAETNSDMAATAWFFGTVLRGETNLINAVRAELAHATGHARAFIEKVLANAAAQPMTRITSGTDLQCVWAEYLATGDFERVERIFSTVCDPHAPAPAEVSAAARELLVKVARYHAEVYTCADDLALVAEEPCEAKLQAVVEQMREEFGRKASDLLTLAGNLRRQRSFEDTRRVIQTALKLFPDSARAQAELAALAEEEGNLDEALLAARRAAAIFPGNPENHYRLGRLHFLRREHKSAIASYETAIKLGYSFNSVWHALGRAYQESGNHKDAIRCFKQYLALEPHGPNAPLVKEYLASMNQPVEDDPTDLKTMLVRGEYDALENRLREILRSGRRNPAGQSEIYLAYGYLCRNPTGTFGFEQFLDRFRRWAEARPDSHFAHAAYGTVLIDHAWHARGSGWGTTVTPEGWKLFEERLQKARAALERAYELDPSDPLPPAWLITVARGLGLDRDEMEKQFARGVAADPAEYTVYSSKLTYLMPKWHGSEREMFEFARKAAAESPTNSIVPAVILDAHWEMFTVMYSKDKRYFRRPGVWEEMKQVFATVCDRFPGAHKLRNRFALAAFYAGDYATAARQLDLIGEQWLSEVWGERSFFDRVRAETQKRLKRQAALHGSN